jgi:hypothetical protein
MFLYFTRTGTMLSFLTALNLYKPSDDFFDDKSQKVDNRPWRLSKIDPLNSNIAFVLYKHSGSSDNKPEYMVKVFHNEKQIRIADCYSHECDFNLFFEYYSQIINKCKDSREICSLQAQNEFLPVESGLIRLVFYVALTIFVALLAAFVLYKKNLENYSRFI